MHLGYMYNMCTWMCAFIYVCISEDLQLVYVYACVWVWIISTCICICMYSFIYNGFLVLSLFFCLSGNVALYCRFRGCTGMYSLDLIHQSFFFFF